MRLDGEVDGEVGVESPLPTTQHGYRVHEWGSEPVWEEIPVGEPGPGECLVRVDACGIGLTVLNCINGDLARDDQLLPLVPGHEIAGTVVSIGEGVEGELLGRRVVAYFYLSCGSCSECTGGEDSRCLRLAGWLGVHRDGGYAPFTTLPAANLVPIPESVDAVAATVIPDAVATPVHVAGRAGIGERDRVVVIGAGGGVGIHMVQVAGLRSAEVAGLDVAPDKLAEVESLGVTAVDSSDFAALTSPFGSRPPTVVIDLVGTIATTRWGIEALGPGGRYVALTTFRDRPVPFESRELVFSESSIVGSRYARKRELAEAARLVAEGAVRPVIGEVTGPGGVPDIHARLRAGTLLGRGALDWRGDERGG